MQSLADNNGPEAIALARPQLSRLGRLSPRGRLLTWGMALLLHLAVLGALLAWPHRALRDAAVAPAQVVVVMTAPGSPIDMPPAEEAPAGEAPANTEPAQSTSGRPDVQPPDEQHPPPPEDRTTEAPTVPPTASQPQTAKPSDSRLPQQQPEATATATPPSPPLRRPLPDAPSVQPEPAQLPLPPPLPPLASPPAGRLSATPAAPVPAAHVSIAHAPVFHAPVAPVPVAPLPITNVPVAHAVPRAPASAAAQAPPAAALAPSSAAVGTADHAPSPNDLGAYRDRVAAHLRAYQRYPAMARARREEGLVVLDVTIQRDGQIVAMKIDHASGSRLLDEEALATMKRADPLPAMPADVPGTTMALMFPLRFHLE